MPTTSLRNLVRLYTPIRQVTRPPLPLFRHAGPILRRPATTKVRVPPSRNSFEKVRFVAADIPRLSFWTANARPPTVPSEDAVGAAECLEACRQYVALAVEDRPGWRQRALATKSGVSPDGKIPLYTLHYAAVVLMQQAAAGHLATHILHTGVLLGYAPSVLTMARLGLERDLLDRAHFAPAKEALEKLASAFSSSSSSAGTDRGGVAEHHVYLADALTAMGLACARSSNTAAAQDRALRFFGSAGRVASSYADAGAWQWRASAALEQAAIYLRRGDRERARAALRGAAYELDSPEACFRYAQLLGEEGDDPEERVALLRRAAVSGVEEAARELSRVELRRLEDDDKGRGLSEGEKRYRRFLADEWSAIAGDKALI
ncbi:hypothetical protein F4818DRAFT_37781 [Hypoxylon cercidicola]|nr:hypothetical protein F4818DRAFT_37781 [Hypoxylon cercidicola]